MSRALSAFALVVVVVAGAIAQAPWGGVLDEHPRIQYARRPTTDPIAKLSESLARSGRSLQRDPRTGYLLPALEALGIPQESQLLVFSKTGVQRAYTNPHNPRALFFDASVVVGYVPGAPALEIAAHDPQQGVIFYVVDQIAAAPTFTRRTSCLACHVSATTLNVPGLIARSNTVDADGDVMPQQGSNDVTHETPHPDRWGGWFVTSEDGAAPYSQRAHAGNITTSRSGTTSNQVFTDWMSSSPEERGYFSPLSDIVSLLVFDHQARAINLLTRLNWESRIADGAVPPDLVNELADYLLFVGEVPPSVPLTPRAGFAQHLVAATPKDRQGRSLGQLDLVNRLFRYPCSYLVYSPAFDALAPAIKQAVYARMIEILSGRAASRKYARFTEADRHAVLEILKDTKPDFRSLFD
jgi:hypothetical protein